MATLKCPHCGQAFSVDDTELSSIIQQIRDREFKKDLEARINELKEDMQEKHELKMKAKEDEVRLSEKEKHENEVEELKEQLKKAEEKNQSLKAKLDGAEDKKKIAVMEAVKQIETKKQELESALSQERSKAKLLLEQKDEQIAYYKDLKAKMSTKMVGESLEQHCEIEFEKLRATAFRNAYFETILPGSQKSADYPYQALLSFVEDL